jgi:hypothetical protein
MPRPGKPGTPALAVRSGSVDAVAERRAAWRSAYGEREMFAVQTKSTRRGPSGTGERGLTTVRLTGPVPGYQHGSIG